MSRRKHYKQMSPSELETLRDAIDKLDKTTLADLQSYVLHRMSQRKLEKSDILNAIRGGRIIEAHNKVRNDIRVVLRQETKRGFSVCVVVSLLKGSIITVYRNDNSDNHYTIDWSEYKWRANLVSEVKHLMYRKQWGANRSRSISKRS